MAAEDWQFSPASNAASWLRLPQAVAETWVVGRHFHVTPLLDFETDGSFIVLAISGNHCRVFRGDRWTFAEADVPGLPANEKEALPPADHQRTAEAHGGVKQGKSRQTVISGQGGASDYAKPEFLAYCRQVDAADLQFSRPVDRANGVGSGAACRPDLPRSQPLRPFASRDD